MSETNLKDKLMIVSGRSIDKSFFNGLQPW